MSVAVHPMFARTMAGEDTQVKVGVGVVIFDDQGRILLERRSDCGLWGLPGGKVDPGESLVRCAVREVMEETGLEAEVTGLIGVYSEPDERIVTYLDNGDVRHLIDVVVEARVLGGEMRLSPESLELKYFDLTAIPKELAPPAWLPLADVVAGRTGMLR